MPAFPRFILIVSIAAFVWPAAGEPLARDRQFSDSLYVRGYHEMAAREYLGLIRSDANRVDMDVILYRLADCLRRTDDHAGAVGYYSQLIEQYPKSSYGSKARLRLAELMIDSQNYEQALELLGAVLKTEDDPELIAASLYHQGMAFRGKGEPARAGKSFQKAVDQYEKSPFASYAALELAETCRGTDAGIKKAEALYIQVEETSTSPRLAAEACFQRAALAFQNKKYSESAGAYQQLLDKWPDDQRVDEARAKAAWAFHYAGRYEDCLELAQTQPESDEWLYLQAAAQRRLRKQADALANYELLLNNYPDSRFREGAFYEKALINFDLEAYEEAISLLESALEFPSIQKDACILLAEAYAKLGENQKATKAYSDFVDRFPDSPQLPDILYKWSELMLVQKKYVKAEELLKRIVSDYPKAEVKDNARFSLAYCLEKQGDWDAALAQWDMLSDSASAPGLTEQACFRKGLVEIQLHHDKAATVSLQKYLKKYPAADNWFDASYRLGLLHTRAGKVEQAEEIYRYALSRDPSAEWSVKIKLPLAVALQQSGRDAEAADLLRPLLETNIQKEMNPALLHWFARYLLDAEDFAAAEKVARALAKKKSWQQAGWYLAGLAAVGEKDKKTALESFKKAAEAGGISRESADAAFQWGLLALEKPDAESALKAFTLAGEKAVGDVMLDVKAGSYYGLGRVAELQEQWEVASRYYLSVGLLFDDENLVPECLYRASVCLNKLGRKDEEQLTRQELIERYADTSWAAKAGGVEKE